jgi:hypothetical protein
MRRIPGHPRRKKMGRRPKKLQGESSTREVILKAAIQEFINNGFHGARMDRIADTAAVTKAMIYYYFSSKDAVYDEVLRSIVTPILTELSNITDEPTEVPEMIGRIIDIYMSVFLKYPDYVRLLQYELIMGGQHFKKLEIFKTQPIPFSPINGKIYLYFKRKMREGKIRKVEIFQLFLSIIGQVIMPYLGKPLIESIVQYLPLDFNKVFSRLIADRKKFVIDLVMTGIQPPKVTT